METERTNETAEIGFMDTQKIKSAIEREPGHKWIVQFRNDNPSAGVFLVGGAVRDLLLGRKTKDFDFVIRGLSHKKIEQWLSKSGKVQLVGKGFGVYKYIPTGSSETVDIALPRTEHIIDGSLGGSRDFEVQSNPDLPIESDLSRRDFTINAIAYDVENNILVDPFSGAEDLKAKIIRAVGMPEERFKEDLSRILRAIRIATELGFEIDLQTWSSVVECAPRLSSERVVNARIERVVPYETVGKEFLKSLYSDPVRAIELFESSGILDQILPEYLLMKGCEQPSEYHTEGDVWKHTKLAVRELMSDDCKRDTGIARPSARLVLATLLHDIGKPPTQKTPERDGTDRVRFDGHNDVGAQMASDIIERLRLMQFPQDHPLHIKKEDIVWLIRNHLVTMNDTWAMRPSAFEKYFMSALGRDLIGLTRADTGATVWADGSRPTNSVVEVLKRVEQLRPIVEQRELKKGVLRLVSGEDIIANGLKPGPAFREILAHIRDAELEGKIKTREEALEYLKMLIKNYE